MADLERLESELQAQIAAAEDEAALEAVRVAALGKKGSISDLLKTLGSMSPDERRSMGPAINGLKDKINDAIQVRRGEMQEAALEKRLATEKVDVTLPVRESALEAGRIHPVSQVMDELTAIFADMGFSIAEGPHIEDDFHNFTALNIPADHPARQEMDTFYFPEADNGSRMLLRTHTSPVQIRTMLDNEPADPRHRAGPRLPLRLRPDAHADVPSGRGAGHRRGGPSRPPEMGAAGILQGVLRDRRRQDALPRLALPLHGALHGGRHQLLARRQRAAHRRGRRLAGDPRLRRRASERAAGLQPRSEALPGLRLGHGDRTASPC